MEQNSLSTITIRTGTTHDLPQLSYLTDKELRSSLPKVSPYGIEYTHNTPFITPTASRLWIVEEKEQPIGHFYLWNINHAHQWLQLICSFSSQISEETIIYSFQEMLGLLKDTIPFHKIMLLVQSDHSFFLHIARKLSFLFEGTLHHHLNLNNIWHDISIFSLIPEEMITSNQRKKNNYEHLISQAAQAQISDIIVRAIIVKPINDHLHLLLLKRKATFPFPNVEEPPGGILQNNEPIDQALTRIVKDQTNLELDFEHLFLSFTDIQENETTVRELFFRVNPISWNISMNSKEHLSYQWEPLHNLPKSQLHPDMIQILSPCSPYENIGTSIAEHQASFEIGPPTDMVEKTILTGSYLKAHAAKGYPPIEPIAIYLQDSIKRIVGGILGESKYGAFIIHYFWIDSAWKEGWAQKLLEQIEKTARTKKHSSILISLMEWEEIRFFEEHGFRINTQITGFYNQSRQLWLHKELDK